MNAAGYNPLRWDCEKKGCFNKKKRPKIEQFASCFPRSINFGDVDGIVELNGYGLVLEWKEEPMALSTGQRLLWERLTKEKALTTLCVAGDAETMLVTHLALFCDGEFRKWKPGNLDDVKQFIVGWVNWTNRRKSCRNDSQTSGSSTPGKKARQRA